MLSLQHFDQIAAAIGADNMSAAFALRDTYATLGRVSDYQAARAACQDAMIAAAGGDQIAAEAARAYEGALARGKTRAQPFLATVAALRRDIADAEAAGDQLSIKQFLVLARNEWFGNLTDEVGVRHWLAVLRPGDTVGAVGKRKRLPVYGLNGRSVEQAPAVPRNGTEAALCAAATYRWRQRKAELRGSTFVIIAD